VCVFRHTPTWGPLQVLCARKPVGGGGGGGSAVCMYAVCCRCCLLKADNISPRFFVTTAGGRFTYSMVMSAQLDQTCAVASQS
jgi:hypothetical protein